MSDKISNIKRLENVIEKLKSSLSNKEPMFYMHSINSDELIFNQQSNDPKKRLDSILSVYIIKITSLKFSYILKQFDYEQELRETLLECKQKLENLYTQQLQLINQNNRL